MPNLPTDLHFRLCLAIHHLTTPEPLPSQVIPAALRTFEEALALVERDPQAAEDFREFAVHLKNVNPAHNYEFSRIVADLQKRLDVFLQKGDRQ